MLRSLLNNALRSRAGAGAARSSGYGSRSRGMGRSAGYTSRGRGAAPTSGGGIGGQVARTVLGRLTRGR